MKPAPDYLITASEVPEVSLIGNADAEFWRERLKKEELYPYPGGDKIEIKLEAAKLRWKGIDSQEFTLSLAVSDRAEDGEKNWFLIQAFNSSIPIAWIERAFFQTPFSHGGVRLEQRVPVSFKVNIGKEWFVSAQMSAQGRPVQTAYEVYEGPIYLPGDLILGIRHHFFASLGGRTHTYPFLNGQDSLWINPSTHRKVFNWLLVSHFSPQEWKIRPDAIHSRTLTVQTRRKP